jgi:hypothetical protein
MGGFHGFNVSFVYVNQPSKVQLILIVQVSYESNKKKVLETPFDFLTFEGSITVLFFS